VVRQITKGSTGSVGVFLEGGQDDPVGVLCYTVEPAPWNKALPGQTVKLQGGWPERALGATLVECRILEVTGKPPPILTAQELAVNKADMARLQVGKKLKVIGDYQSWEDGVVGIRVSNLLESK
jgi:hypothetical protein